MRKILTRAAPLYRLSSSSPYSLRSHLFLLHSLATECPGAKRAPVLLSSDPAHLPHYSSWRSHHDDESRTVKVFVWWDFENCSVPAGVNVFLVAQRITSALRANGIKGPVTINAFGDVLQLSRAKQEALASTGISLTHVPNSGKNSADRSLLVDLIHWASQNPPPAHLFLISGDRDFANILHRLRMSNYNILLAGTDGALGVLCSAASIMWQWNALVRGENLIGRHFNYPPDGPYASWYGHYKGPLEDPFASVEPEEIAEQPRPIPKTLVNRIRQLLMSYPDGINISLLRQELEKANVGIDKDFFGYKKFSKFLLALPNVLKLEQHPAGEGQPLVYGIHVKASEGPSGLMPHTHVEKDIWSPSIFEENPKMHQPVEARSKQPINLSSNVRAEDRSLQLDIKGSRPTTKTYQAKQEVSFLKFTGNGPTAKTSQLKQEEVPSSSLKESELRTKASQLKQEEVLLCKLKETGLTTKASQLKQDEVHSSMLERCGSTTKASQTKQEEVPSLELEDVKAEVPVEEGTFQKIWRTWFGRTRHKSHENVNGLREGDKIHFKCEKIDTNEKVMDEKTLNLTDVSAASSDSSSSKDMGMDVGKSPSSDERPPSRAGFYNWIARRFKFWRNEGSADQNSVQIDKTMERSNTTTIQGQQDNKKTNVQSENDELFNKSYFWDDLESFLCSAKGFALVSRSRNRDQLGQELQKEGPLTLMPLDPNHLSRLIDILIVEKKWVEEYPSLFFPFKLVLPSKRKCTPSNTSNGLSSIFASKLSNSALGENPIVGPPPQNLIELKSWLNKCLRGAAVIKEEDIKRQFEGEFNQKLDCSFYGFPTIENLLEACSLKTSGVDENIKKPFNRSRQEILSDCKQLLEEIFEKCPQPVSFQLGSFKPLFYERYGYVLDYQMAGFPKLIFLLQSIPGVKVENNIIYPDRKVTKADSKRDTLNYVLESVAHDGSDANSEAANLSRGINDVNLSTDGDSVWEELGPVSKTGFSANGADSAGNGRRNSEIDNHVNFNDESLLSDEDVSDSEDDKLAVVGSKEEEKGSTHEESSLIQILDSWYGSKDVKDTREPEDNFSSNSKKAVDSESADDENYHCQTEKIEFSHLQR
ncbi:hypothetical protein H6P81_015627 [Aristolochia fimbriata]|uniref:HTH OST-type domain-containing protein n=1 Tax=Aristolochia fimbriata TaxID=158543 RepID=A0AAV7E978_ARIFI|nr:hypothetical protein H6P81_015627 [Aristolochia fimbriata]